MKKSILFVLIVFFASVAFAQKKNVLFIMADDFNIWLNKAGYYPQSITPNLDKLANRGVLFADASCSSPVCNPSRNALWSGYRPSTTGISSNKGGYVREIPGFENIVSMHQYFKQNGYFVYGGGKLWHPGKMGSTETDPTNWSKIFTGPTGANGGSFYKWESDADDLFKWSAGEYELENANDTKLANHMADLILNYAGSENKDKPFFIGCGFFRPHLPWNCEKRFWDLFDPDSLQIPQGYLENDLDDIDNTGVDKKHAEVLAENKWKDGIRAYLANLAYADYNVGIVLDALDSSEFRENTIVCFMGDHGWHLGEKDRWSKYALYDMANRTTLIIYDPTAEGNGKICKKVVSLQDLYPTLVALTGLPEKQDIEGNNIEPLLKEPELETWNKSIVMTYSGTNIIKTNEWRFVDSDKSPQLYHTKNDPYEWYNLVKKPEHASLISRLKSEMDSIIDVGLAIKDKLTSTGDIPHVPEEKSILKSTLAYDSCLLLDLTYTAALVKLTVYDLAGRKMQENKVYGEMDNVRFRLNNHLKPGMYILHMEDEEGEISEKFVLN
jgi:arylsulfatase A-like enzyme